MSLIKVPPNVSTLSREVLVDKIKGVIFGNAIGDAIGLATEFLSKNDSEKNYGKGPLTYDKIIQDFHRSRWRKGDWTDDTDQMILILEGIIFSQGNVDHLDFSRRLKNWIRHGFPELGDSGGLGIGQTVYTVVSDPNFEKDPHTVSEQKWEKTLRSAAANGALMRTSVLGIPYFHDLEKVFENTHKIAKTTHADPRCLSTSCIVTICISLVLQGRETHSSSVVENIVQEAIDYVKPKIPLLINDPDPLGLEGYARVKSLSELKLDEEPKIGYTYKCFGAAIWAFIKGQDFEQTITKIVLEGGDADTNAAVAGALLGCKLGYKNLPSRWLEGLVHKEWLERKVNLLLKLLDLS